MTSVEPVGRCIWAAGAGGMAGVVGCVMFLLPETGLLLEACCHWGDSVADGFLSLRAVLLSIENPSDAAALLTLALAFPRKAVCRPVVSASVSFAYAAHLYSTNSVSAAS